MPQQLSRAAHQRLTAELEDLTTVGRARIAQAIEAARALGDLSENGDYHAAKDEQGRMEARIRQLESVLRDAEVVDDAEVAAAGEVLVGTVVTLRYQGDDDTEEYYVGSIEEQREGVTVVSPESPLGKALLGRKPGESATYQTPTGATLTVEVVAVGVG